MAFVYDRETRRHTVDGERVPSVTEVISGLGWLPTEYYTRQAAIRGVRVHSATVLLEGPGLKWESLKRISKALGEDIEPYVRAYDKFLVREKWESSQIEVPLASEVYRFVGCPDRIHKSGRRGLDLKTGSWSKMWKYQMGGYYVLTGVEAWDILELRPDGTYRVTPIDAAQYGNKFLYMMETFREGVRNGVYEYAD
jgi:hypothetical protein